MAMNPALDVPQPRSPWRGRALLPSWILATFFLQVVALGTISVLSYRGFRERLATADLTTGTLETLQQIESVVSLLTDAETGQRGYLLTREERYLQPYNDAAASLRSQLVNLQQVVAGNPAQEKRVALLGSLADEKLTELRETISLEQDGDTEAAMAIVHTNRGKEIMDGVREVAGAMETDEHAALETALADGRDSAHSLSLLMIAGPLLLLSLISASAWAAARFFRRLEIQGWVRAGAALLNSRLQGQHSLAQLGDRTVSFLAEYLGAYVGAVHVVTPDGGLARCGGYALASSGATGEPRRAGAGLVSQAAKQQRTLHVSDVPADYLPINSSLGTSQPRELLVVPAVSDRETSAVIEFGFFRSVGGPEFQLLERAAESVGAAFRAYQYRARQDELLEETQRQAQELQAQQEELEATNKNLEEQAGKLRESQRELQHQQAELEQTNAYLEEQTETLESQKEALLTTQELLQHKAAEIERANRYKSEFLANMSHELRTPLNSSLILAKLLADNKQGTLTAEQVKYARTIYAAGNDLLTLINDILDLAKIEAGKVDLVIESTGVERLFDALKQRFEPLASERGLEMRFTVDPGCPTTLETDPDRLLQILTNLLSNAVKFTEKGHVHLLARRQDSSRVAFTVEDSGMGIPAEQHEVIFEAFRQADGTTNRKHGGTGLGLSICRELAALLDGEIQLRSTPGQGSAFTVLLPLRGTATAAAGPATAASGPPLRLVESAPSIEADPETSVPFVEDDRDHITDPRRVLLVIEDDAVFAEILRDLGREHNFECVVARDAAEGLRFARDYGPAAVVLDIGLPDHSGLTVLELLKRDPSVRHIPVHVMSVHDYQRVARELGAVGYALKPVKREQLAGAFRLLEERLSRTVKSVLVVEDEPAQREAISRLLQADGVEIVAVANADEALTELRRATFDCCVLDLMLPKVSGFELLEQMSEHETCSFPPVIVYTARALSTEEEQQLRRLSSSIIIKGARSPERLLEEVTLFLHQVEAELPEEQQQMLRAARDREAVFDGRRILLVEDDVRNVFALARALEPKGLCVEIARNGHEALAKLAEDPPVDVVLMDVMMPEMDGLTATREIRKNRHWAALPIIALTAKAMPDDRQACLDAGASEYIAKPIDVEKLLSLLRVWMPR
jgi:CheY-like chemotaxis protein/CHASE3 domain sensor protein